MELSLKKGIKLKDKYEVKERIAGTDISNIYLCVELKTDKMFVIKEMFVKGCFRDLDNKTVVNKNKGILEEAKESYRKEGKVLKEISHKNIVKFKEIFEENNTVYIVTKYYKGLDYERYIQARKINIKKEICKNIYPILDAIEYLHKKKYIHRDIKPNNIIITKDGPILLDFGAVSHINSKNKRINISNGFSPIEFYEDDTKQGYYSDVYSIAATIYYMLNKKIPILAKNRVVEDELFLEKRKDKVELLDKIILKNMDLDYKKRAKNIKVLRKELKLIMR
ncbi:protein kinase domain-containing protein [Haliovirga abyssi]|uniref:Protein kinase domain-containing protein n=1 Tax=Haliovirga abyssi TaxID=2996794 RepID=A0AAU9DQ78_9FUSO|nr:protein kinase [Haliovirga abyssi]BDU50608.1 hypothetical protein HLVA_11770 [Haliovirga abyssi]